MADGLERRAPFGEVFPQERGDGERNERRMLPRGSGAKLHPLVRISPTRFELAAQLSAAQRTRQACFRVPLGTPSRSICSRHAAGAWGSLKRSRLSWS